MLYRDNNGRFIGKRGKKRVKIDKKLKKRVDSCNKDLLYKKPQDVICMSVKAVKKLIKDQIVCHEVAWHRLFSKPSRPKKWWSVK